MSSCFIFLISINMQNNFIEFIDTNYNEILGGYLKDALVIFDSYNMNDHEIPLTNLMYGSVNHVDPATTVDRFVNVIRSFLLELGNNFGISFYEEIELSDLVIVFNTLLDIEYYLDHEQILRATETENESLETLAHIFEIVGNVSPSWTFVNILYVDPKLINKIMETHHGKFNMDQEESSEDKKDNKLLLDQINNLKLYREFLNDDQLVCYKLIRRGHSLETDFKTNVQYIRNHLEFAQPDKLALELVGILYFSSDTASDPLMGFKKHSEYLFDDLKKITQMDSEVSKLISKFLNYKTTRKPQ